MEPNNNSTTILLVDHSQMLHGIIGPSLEQQGYCVVAVTTFIEALEELSKRAFNYVIADYNLDKGKNAKGLIQSVDCPILLTCPDDKQHELDSLGINNLSIASLGLYQRILEWIKANNNGK